MLIVASLCGTSFLLFSFFRAARQKTKTSEKYHAATGCVARYADHRASLSIMQNVKEKCKNGAKCSHFALLMLHFAFTPLAAR
jgi:hypothetical protein